MLLSDPRVILLSFAFASCVSSQWCSYQTFGRPDAGDCASILNVLPQEAHPVDQHVFVEPPFLRPPFTTVVDGVGHGIVQLPKIWVVGSCRLALLSFATPDLVANTPTTNAWSSLSRDVRDLDQKCVSHYGGGGLRIIHYTAQTFPPLVAYFYASDSNFESDMNHYQSFPQPIHPGHLGSSSCTVLNTTCSEVNLTRAQ